jgi:protein-S-isoprenylcysteine O-methyltransferase Ste14
MSPADPRGSPISRHWLELKVSPVLLALLIALLMGGVARGLPGLTITVPGSGLLGAASAAIGLALAAMAVVRFRRRETTVWPFSPERASTLVVDGVLGRTRNPMYLGMALVLAGWGLLLSNFAALALVALFVLWLDRFQIRPEERALRQRFGDEFDRYAAKVRRWL